MIPFLTEKQVDELEPHPNQICVKALHTFNHGTDCYYEGNIYRLEKRITQHFLRYRFVEHYRQPREGK
jgi:hypothetical protein